MKKVFKRLICFLLVIVTIVSITATNVYADSNSRIATYIRLAALGEVTDGNTEGMTEDQLRFLGLYLSNFYIPFGTEIGISGSETAETVKTDMVDTLQQKFAFSEDLATSIVETVFGYTRSSLEDLKVYGSKGYQDGDYVEIPIAPNYYNFLRLMEGRADDVFHKYFINWNSGKDDTYNLGRIAYNMYNKQYTLDEGAYPEDNISKLSSGDLTACKAILSIGRGNIKYLYFAYSSGGEVKPVADCYIGRVDDELFYNGKDKKGTSAYTPSQVAFMKCLEASNIDKGYGYSFMDFAKSDNLDSEGFNELKDSSNNTDYTKMSILGSTMAVDCFGDIVSMGGNHQVVVMPGCINPYVWQSVNDKGEDIENRPAGLTYNIANALSMTQSETETSGSGISELIKSYPRKGRFKANFEVLNKNLNDNKQDFSLINNADGDYAIVALRQMRGTREIDLGGGILGWGNEERTFFFNAIEGFKEMYPGDLTFYYSSSSRNSADRSKGEVNNAWFGTASYDCVVPRSKYSDNKYYGADMSNELSIFTNVVFIDNLGAYTNIDGSSQDYSAFNISSFLNDKGKTGSDNKITFSSHSFGNLYNDIKTGKLDIPDRASEQALCTLYVTYCLAGLYDESSKADTIGKLGYRINAEGLPSMSNSPIAMGDLATVDAEVEAIKDWLYYILHPTEGFDYVRILITNKVNHLLLGWHSDMVGTNGVGITTGTTKYRSNMGYVTMPDLSEIQWTNALINFYNDCIPFLIVLLIVIMLFAFITGILDLQHAAFGVLLFSIFTLLPVNLINASVEQSNRISQNIYGDKFTYWALVQQESYAQAIDEAANAPGSSGTSSYDNYLRTLYEENQTVYTNQGGESILLKWQAPKKMASLVLTESDAKALGGLSEVGQQMLSGMLNKTYSGQSYTDDEEAVYMYRSYLDISNFSRYIYQGINGKGNNPVKHREGFNGVKTDNWTSFTDTNGNLLKSSTQLAKEYKDYISEGYNNGTDFGVNDKFSDQFYLTVPLSSNIISDTLKVSGKINTFSDSKDMIPINSDVFNFGIPMFTAGLEFSAENLASTGFITEAERKKNLEKFVANYKEEDFVGLAAYGLYSENPFYYFSWKLYADGLDTGSLSGSTGYKTLLLGKEDGGYFYNTKGNGGLKDFMNMKGLFTYIIPYMKQCNDVVREWDNVFGIFIYDGVPTEEGHWDEVKNDPELEAKYWHNLNVTRLYDIYCPWVDVMYDCSYADAETITVMGRQVVVQDPLNPNSYPEDRHMIFSESEMADYGLSEADLTKVEKIILKCNEGYQERMYELLNYYNFSDVALNSAAAMNCAFVFNNNFSENGLFTDNHNIYPQSFDLANFSYDAFLRFILSNSTGESMLEDTGEAGAGTSTGKTSGDFYERLVNKSSIVTVIVMLILDVISIYLIPAFRIFFLIAIFLVSIMIVVVSACRIEDNMKFVRKVITRFVLPLCLFFLATVLFSWVISLFMGTGSNAVTQTNTLSISMGDPVVTMLIMIAIDIILLIVYWKIIKGALKDIKHHAKLIGGFTTALCGAAVGFVAGAVSKGINGIQNVGSKAVSGYRRHKYNKRADKDSESLETIAENSKKPAQQGTGTESSRASNRSSNGASNSSEERTDTSARDREKDAPEMHNTSNRDKSEDNEKKRSTINDKASKGAERRGTDRRSRKEKSDKGDSSKSSTKRSKVDTKSE